MTKIYDQEGIKGFYKGIHNITNYLGVKAAIVTVPIFYSIYFPLYEYSKSYLAIRLNGSEEKMNLLVYSLAASISAITCDILTNPMWVVRLRYQTEFLHSKVENKESFNLFKEMRKIVKTVNLNVNLMFRKDF